jgi:hypothetical protein
MSTILFSPFLDRPITIQDLLITLGLGMIVYLFMRYHHPIARFIKYHYRRLQRKHGVTKRRNIHKDHKNYITLANEVKQDVF